jgi:hypothetical protein
VIPIRELYLGDRAVGENIVVWSQSAYRQANREQVNAAQRVYRDNNKDRIREYRSEYNKRQYVKHREKILARKREWLEENRDAVRARKRVLRAENIEKVRELDRKTSRTRWQKRRIRMLASGAKSRCVRRGMEFSLDEAWMKNAENITHCPLTGVKLRQDGSGRKGRFRDPYAPSIDRIEPQRGYTPDNTRIICVWANVAKGEMSDREFLALCRLTVEREERKRSTR